MISQDTKNKSGRLVTLCTLYKIRICSMQISFNTDFRAAVCAITRLTFIELDIKTAQRAYVQINSAAIGTVHSLWIPLMMPFWTLHLSFLLSNIIFLKINSLDLSV